MDILRRDLAPIADAAWEEIDSQASRVLKALLTARKFVDVRGPYGLDFRGVSTGRLDLVKEKEKGRPASAFAGCSLWLRFGSPLPSTSGTLTMHPEAPWI